MYYYHHDYHSSIGPITIASNDRCIVGLWLENQRYYMDVLAGKAYKEKETEVIRQAKKWLDRYFNKEKPGICELPLELTGSDFQKQVWNILMEIPYGKVTTYGMIAKQIVRESGRSQMSAQAVGRAVGRNPISIIVPCHRVVGANGSMTGYAGGIEKKRTLLIHEGIMNEWDHT